MSCRLTMPVESATRSIVTWDRLKPSRLALRWTPPRGCPGLFTQGSKSRALYVFAPGAGAGITHSFMEDVAAGLARARHRDAAISVSIHGARIGQTRPAAGLSRYGARRHRRSGALLPGVPLFAGGKSFGGRMTSQAQASSPLPGVRGIIFLGFPRTWRRSPPTRAPRISPTCAFRCSFSRARATSWRT